DAAAQTFDAARGSGRLVACAPRSRIVRDFPAYTLRGAETVFTSGIGIAHGDSGYNFAQMPGWRRRGNLHGYGTSGAPQCAREFFAQVAQGCFHRVQRELRSRFGGRRWRREISSRLSLNPQTCFRGRDRDPALGKPEPLGSCRSDRGGKSASTATDSWRYRASQKGVAPAGAW